ncbi:MAG: hypothetical protein WAN28_07520 [Terracidiphilus sp.]
MRRALAFSLLLMCSPLCAQEIPAPTELMGEPFFVKQKWLIEAENHQDYLREDRLEGLTFDAKAGRLFVAHGPRVEVVNVETGVLEGKITGLREAQSIVLDAAGQYGYISDSGGDTVAVFDRSTLQVVDQIPACLGARSLALEGQTGLLFAVCGAGGGSQPNATGAASSRSRSAAPRNRPEDQSQPVSLIAVMDTENRKARALQPVAGKLGCAQADDNGSVYIAFEDRSGLLQINAAAMREFLRRSENRDGPLKFRPESMGRSSGPNATNPAAPSLPNGVLGYVRLGSQCDHPRALAIDPDRVRVFTACENATLLVTNTGTGALVDALPIGPGTDSVGYDPVHRLIFAANGGGAGSLTIIDQHVTESYHVAQNVPTLQTARNLALDPQTETVYLAVPFMGVKPEHMPARGKADYAGNFEVLAVAR